MLYFKEYVFLPLQVQHCYKKKNPQNKTKQTKKPTLFTPHLHLLKGYARCKFFSPNIQLKDVVTPKLTLTHPIVAFLILSLSLEGLFIRQLST